MKLVIKRNRSLSVRSFCTSLIYIYILWIPLVNFVKISFMGLPLFSVFFLGMSCLMFLIVGTYGLVKAKYLYLLLLLQIVFSFISSIYQGFSVPISLYNDFLYTTPFLLLIISECFYFDIKKVCRQIQYMTCIAGVISALVYMGVIDTGLNYKLSITVLDNTIGLLGLAVSLYLIISNINIVFSWITVIMSAMVLLTGQSRARTILALVIVFSFILYVLFIKRGKKVKSIATIAVVMLIILFFVNKNIDVINDYLGFLIGKFEIIGEDSSFEYRITEMKVHFDLFKTNPLWGIGCGVLNSKFQTSLDSFFYGHNMFTAVLAVNGIFFFIVFMITFVRMIVKVIQRFMLQKSAENLLILVLAFLLVPLSISSAGFGKPTTHIMMFLIGAVIGSHLGPNSFGLAYVVKKK